MKTAFPSSVAVLLALSTAGCATMHREPAARGGVEVARFHLGDPIARSQIAIEPFDKADSGRPEYPAYAAAVARQLTRLGWTVVTVPGPSEQVALIDVEQGTREAIARLTAARIGRGVSPGAALGTGANMTATLLEVGIRRRSDGTMFWEGRAVAEAGRGTAEASGPAAVEKLAEALFRDFPGESGRSIRLK